MKKKFILFFIMFGAFIPFVNASEVNKCKVSDSYLYWLSLPKEEKSKYIMPEYCKSNGIEDYNFNTHENKKLNDPSYPPYYLSVSTPVRNQSVTPACWAFAATTVLESHILKQYGVDLTFSRGHLNYFESQSFNDITSNKYGMLRDVNDGGNHNVSSTYYINRHGPVLESEFKTDTESDPLPRINSKPVLNKKNYLDVDNIEYEYRSKSGACTEKEISKIKGLLMEYGPTGADIYMDFDLALESGAYITKSDNNMALSNHAVTIVGWDDNYSLDNFEESTYKPMNPGAWIIQNSYGNDFGDNGLMYISYEDDQVCTNLFSIRSVDASTEDNNYVNSELKSNITINANAGMSVFKKKTTTDEYLTKVSFEVNKPTSYNVYYYPSNASGKKLSEMIKIASGSVDYKGWVTVKPDKSIVIPSNVTENSIAVNIANGIIPATGKTQ